jgi:hypothetical protein
LKTNNILVPEEFCFRKGISTENAAYKLIDSVLNSLNQKMHVGGIFCDLAKAFDCVNHVAKAFNSYFLSSVNKLVGQSFSNACFLPLANKFLTDGKSEMVNIPVTEAEVMNMIKH